MTINDYTNLIEDLKEKVLIDDVSRWKFRVTKRLLKRDDFALYASLMTGIKEKEIRKVKEIKKL